ncbi:hypothetical protein GBAR_LOCUS14756 [Geodia barretti]|uniref:Uncharacterized protein n=1 Tax=Geodia barretti TaxID=519541 RepID=A0AA35S8T0_GEOBA|nr:hypothetical protein GBAR_LOCUS14756 [Geodia barretti]
MSVPVQSVILATSTRGLPYLSTWTRETAPPLRELQVRQLHRSLPHRTVVSAALPTPSHFSRNKWS